MLWASPSSITVSSEWLCISMKPGATTRPRASIDRAAVRSPSRPMAAIFPPRMPTSATNDGLPVPSTMRPSRMRMSKSGDCLYPLPNNASNRTGTANVLFIILELSFLIASLRSALPLRVRAYPSIQRLPQKTAYAHVTENHQEYEQSCDDEPHGHV